MAVIKCKMCGGDLVLVEGQSVAECEYCGTRQTVPAADNDKKLALFARAGRLRAACEFDKAAGIYETIVADFPEEAESYWGLVLCKYGIEYVTDPATGKKVPTCHRSSFDSILQDSDFEQAMENADPAARRLYREEAKQLENIRRGIIAVSSNEQPYDIFICYKETDEKGQRTLDSVLAQDIYDALTAKDYRIFFSRITLEEKLGVEYEPYIFAALNSAKVMIAVGTDYEYFNAVWVKNEWSRFLKLMAQDKSKHLIPCFKGIDAYDMPAEFARLQAQDLGKVGAVQDLIRGIEKLIPRQKAEKIVQERVIYESSNNKVASLLDRGFMALEDGEWERADNFFEEALNNDSKNPQGYLGKLMAELRVSKQEALKDCAEPFDNSNNYSKIIRFADDALREELTGYIAQINERKELARLEKLYQNARRELERANSEAQYKAAAKRFAAINGYKDSAAFEKRCLEKAEVARLDVLYAAAKALMTGSKISNYQEAIQRFEVLADWRDSSEQIEICQHKIAAIEEQKARKAQKAQKPPKEPKAAKEQSVYYNRKKRKLPLIVAVIVCACIALVVIMTAANTPQKRYDEAVAMMHAGNYEEAIAAFEALQGYEDSEGKIAECKNAILERTYQAAVALMDAGSYEEAIAAFEALSGYKDSADKITVCRNGVQLEGEYRNAVQLMVAGNYADAITTFETLAGFKDSADLICECHYLEANGRKDEGDLLGAMRSFSKAGDYKDSTAQINALRKLYQKPLQPDNIGISGGVVYGRKTDGTLQFASTNRYAQFAYGWEDITAIAASGAHIVGLKTDGTVVAAGENFDGECDVSGWTDIVDIRVGYDHTVGLKSDGTVVAVGRNNSGQCNVSGWTDIIAIYAMEDKTVGLKADGTVESTYYELFAWKDIVCIFESFRGICGLKADGTVIATGEYVNERFSVSDWADIVDICAGNYHTVGLKSDGTVVAAGGKTWQGYSGACDVSDWTDIVAISIGNLHTVGLKKDGTVVAVGNNDYGQCDVSGWTDIVAISAAADYTVGLKADGTVLATGCYMMSGGKFYFAVSHWKDIVAIKTNGYQVIGLKADGTAVFDSVSSSSNVAHIVSKWKDIKVPE